MKHIVMCVGISGSGKSTWTTNLIQGSYSLNNEEKYLRINRDDIRKTLVSDLENYYERKDINDIEKLVNDIEKSLFYKIVNNVNFNLIIDNTNLKQSYIKKWLTLISDYETLSNSKIDLKFKLFDIDLNKAKDRVCYREYKYNYGDHNYVDKKVEYINKQYEDYQNIKKYIIDNFPKLIL